MTPATLIAAMLAAGDYPLAAAFVVDGKVTIAQMGVRDVEVVAVPGVTPLSVDLSPDRRRLVVSGSPPDGGAPTLYLVDRKSGETQALSTGLEAAHYQPRFTPDGKNIIFASSGVLKSGPEFPSQVWRMNPNAPSSPATKLSLQPDYCHFSPAPLSADRFASIGTNCFFDFDLRLVSSKDKKSTRLGKTHAANDELAASFDGETLLRSEKLDAEYVFTVFRAKTNKVIYRFRAEGPLSPQPRFVCPRDVMFIENGKYMVLNTKSGEAKIVGAGTP